MSGLVRDLWGAEIEHRRGCFSPTALDRVPGFPEAGTIAWANGVDLALVPLYEEARAHREPRRVERGLRLD